LFFNGFLKTGTSQAHLLLMAAQAKTPSILCAGQKLECLMFLSPSAALQFDVVRPRNDLDATERFAMSKTTSPGSYALK
jgi:hypothetical protein